MNSHTNKTSKKIFNKSIYTLIVFTLFFAMYFSFLPHSSIKVSAAGTISGTIYIDYNMNGEMNTSGVSPSYAIDSGISGTIVTVYASNGSTKSAVAGSNGTYSIDTSSAPALPAGPYRVEFSNLPSGYFPSAVGTNNDSSVQFVADGGSSNVNFGIITAKEYCQNNPRVAVNCYIRQDNDGHVLVYFPYNYVDEMDGNISGTWTASPSRGASLDPTSIAENNQIGTTFGIAWDRKEKKLYSGAFIKRGAKLGALSSESTGAIYVNDDPTASTPSAPIVYVDLNAVFGSNIAGDNPHPTATTDWNNDDPTLPTVHKRGLGGLALSDDGSTLYTVNLNNRRLYSIPTSGVLNSTTITSVAIPTTGLPTSSGNCASSDVRPFALGRSLDGKIYVGGVCSAQSTSNRANLHAYVWEFNAGSFSLVANTSLNLAREIQLPSGTEVRNWEPWSDIIDNLISRPAPALTDISFDGNSMLVAVQDRYGNQVYLPDFYRGYGDILRACPNGTTWTFESNGSCGGTTTGGANNSEGLGGGEYYMDINGDNRQEGGLGAVFQVPGYDHLMTTLYDPVTYNSSGTRVGNFYTGGVQKFKNSDGTMTGAYDVYLQATPNTLGKPNGLGDVEALCNAAPLQIGNRIWNDVDKDGIQDPGESPISGVEVELWADTTGNGTPDTRVGTVIADGNGNYIFGGINDSNMLGNNSVLPNTAYEVRIPSSNFNTGEPLEYFNLTSANMDPSTNGDSRDSDGTMSGGDAIAAFTTGNNSQNNHTYDFGFNLNPTAANASVSGSVKTSYGRSIGGTLITIRNLSTLEEQITRANHFGYFTFDDLQAGDSYIISARHRFYVFPDNNFVFTLQDNVTDIAFVADFSGNLPKTRINKRRKILNQKLMKRILDRKLQWFNWLDN